MEDENIQRCQQLNISDIEHLVPYSTGDDAYNVEKWLNDFSNAISINNCSDHFKYMCMRKMLRGTAAVFLRTCEAKTFDDLRQALLVQFKKIVTPIDVYRQLSKRTREKNENILSYMFSMREIAAQSNLSESEIINAIIEGLRDRSAYTSFLHTAKTFNELRELLMVYDK